MQSYTFRKVLFVHDGTSNMASHLSWDSKRITGEESKVFVRYILQSCACSRNCCSVRDIQSLATELSSLIHVSPKLLSLFQNFKEETGLDTPGMKPPCRTRWTVKKWAPQLPKPGVSLKEENWWALFTPFYQDYVKESDDLTQLPELSRQKTGSTESWWWRTETVLRISRFFCKRIWAAILPKSTQSPPRDGKSTAWSLATEGISSSLKNFLRKYAIYFKELP